MVQKDRHAALMACFLLALVAAQSCTMDRITCTSSNFLFFADGLNLVHFSFTLTPLYVLLGPEQALASAFIHIFPRRSHNMQTARVIKKIIPHIFSFLQNISQTWKAAMNRILVYPGISTAARCSVSNLHAEPVSLLNVSPLINQIPSFNL